MDSRRQKEPMDRLFIRHRKSILAVPLAEVVRFEADDVYVRVLARGRCFLLHMALAEMQRRVPAAKGAGA